MKRLLARAFALWLPILVATSALFLFSYWGIQQSYHQSANDPQIQMAEDAAAVLSSGGVPSELVTHGARKVDIASSLSPWIAVYDASGTVLESSATLDGAPLKLPQGVFDQSTWKSYAEQGISMRIPETETRFTWQPRAGVRQAVVLVRADNRDFVAAGRSLTETENRVSALTNGAAIMWSAASLGSLLVIILLLLLRSL